MIITHNNKKPTIDKSSYIAPNAVICGDVKISNDVRVMFGAQIIAENGSIDIGENCIILENAVIRGTQDNPVSIGKNCLIGPNVHLAGCTIEENVFIATGASVFHGATLKSGSEVRINGVVHLRTVLPENETVPINWVAVGNPAKIFPPEKHEEIWKIQKTLHFRKHVYGIDKSSKNESTMPDVCNIMSKRFSEHFNDEIIKKYED